MSTLKPLVPLNTIGITPPMNPVQGCFVLHDVSRAIYAQVSASPTPPTKVGYVPAVSDGVSGILQLARNVNTRFYSQQVSGFTASLSGTTLTVHYPAVPVMWDGVMQTLAAGTTTGTVATGTYSLVVGYNWGLTQVSLVATASLDPTANYVELCQIVVNTSTTTAVVQNGAVNNKLLRSLCTNGPSGASYSIPVSDATGTMTG